MSAGTVVIAGGILAAVILLTIVAVLCLCRLQYYCCKGAESVKEEEEEAELSTMSPCRPLTYPPTFLTEANGPISYSPTPPPRRGQRSYAFCPSCARCALPFYFQHPEGLCNGGRRIGYRTVQNHLELPTDWASFYHKLNLIRSVSMKKEEEEEGEEGEEVVRRSISTDV
uniref:Family with sequence similarity 163 member B n=1 Tax=Gouania willdenowi TaxID=441366 RepID=A0A8C5E0C4_GOUWI